MRPSPASQVRRQYEIFNGALTVRSALLGLISCSPSRDSAFDDVADTIFLGGPILTMDGAIDGDNIQVAKVDAAWWASPGFNNSFNYHKSGITRATATARPKAS
jgi:hypothetical protein